MPNDYILCILYNILSVSVVFNCTPLNPKQNCWRVVYKLKGLLTDAFKFNQIQYHQLRCIER